MKKSFTLIEILVVATIISLLAAGGMVSYSAFIKNSLDARRKVDLEQIRGALEMYRSNNGYYPSSLTIDCTSPGPLQDPSNIYLSKIPNDPKCQTDPNYTYTASPTGCDNTPTPPNFCSTYLLAATLEDGSNYTAGPYGVETTTPTPTPTPP